MTAAAPAATCLSLWHVESKCCLVAAIAVISVSLVLYMCSLLLNVSVFIRTPFVMPVKSLSLLSVWKQKLIPYYSIQSNKKSVDWSFSQAKSNNANAGILREFLQHN